MTDQDNYSITLTIDTVQFKVLLQEMRGISRAIAASKVRPELGTEKNARFLRVFDFTEQEIADLLGVSQPTVNEALNKKERKKKSR